MILTSSEHARWEAYFAERYPDALRHQELVAACQETVLRLHRTAVAHLASTTPEATDAR